MEYLKENFQKIVIVVITAALIFAAYYLFAPNNDLVTLDTAQENRAEVNRTIQILREVREINLKKDIFTNVVFTSLQDTKVTLPEYEVGKVNPFEPIATSSNDGSSSDSNLQIINGTTPPDGEIQELYIN